MELKGKACFVTGGGSGIGRAAAIAMAKAGGRVMIVDLDGEAAARTATLIVDGGSEAVSVACDVVDTAAVVAAVDRCVSTFGRIDCALNNAGILGKLEPFETQPMSAFRHIIDVNLLGIVNCAQAQIAHMIGREGGGTIVNMASCTGLTGWPQGSAYAASKHAVLGLTKSLALEFSSRGIRVNALCPGFVYSNLTDAVLQNDEAVKSVEALHPIGRLGQPEEIAEAVVYLSSDRASFMSGSAMVVDGGYTAR